MKNQAHMGLSLLISSLALASSAVPAAMSVDPATLGGVDAVTKFCSRADPGSRPAYWALAASIVGKRPADSADIVEENAQYRSAFAQVHEALSSAPHDWALKACRNLISSGG